MVDEHRLTEPIDTFMCHLHLYIRMHSPETREVGASSIRALPQVTTAYFRVTWGVTMHLHVHAILCWVTGTALLHVYRVLQPNTEQAVGSKTQEH